MNNSKAFESGIKKAIAIKNIIVEKSLTELCEAALDNAVESHTFQNRTHNLEDSFTYGIFHDGKLISIKSVGNGEGANDAKNFLSEYTPKHSWSAVIVAGAWYGTLLENFTSTGWGKYWNSGGGRFIVLSDCFDFVVMENKKFFKRNSI